MNKRFDWMTPDEAARELELDEYVWLLNYKQLIYPAVVIPPWLEGLSFRLIDGSERHFADRELTNNNLRICRAIVPEVPSD